MKSGISVMYKKKDDTIDFLIMEIHSFVDCSEAEGKSIDLDGNEKEFVISSEKESFLLPELLSKIIEVEDNQVLIRYSYNEQLYEILQIA